MLRRDFVKLCTLLGISMPLQSLISGCVSPENNAIIKGNFNGKVLIIGAGAAGLTAGYLLAQNGIEFEILEASSHYGGRMKRSIDFADFPIPLGAEWLHANHPELTRILNQSTSKHQIKTVGYDAKDQYGHYEDGHYSTYHLSDPGIDRKFVDSTWYDFFNTYIAPSVLPKIRLNTIVRNINYANANITATDENGNEYAADKVIFTAPLKMLQRGEIDFVPTLPTQKRKAISKAEVWGGLKAFFLFEEHFYPTMLTFKDSDTRQGQRLYYDAAYGQSSEQHVLGLFAVGEQARQYQQLSGEAFKRYVLDELDAAFGGAATKHYVKHMVQDWNEEPFIHAAYLSDHASWRTSTALSEPVQDRIYFAGEAYTRFNDWGSVHNAARAARDAVGQIVG